MLNQIGKDLKKKKKRAGDWVITRLVPYRNSTLTLQHPFDGGQFGNIKILNSHVLVPTFPFLGIYLADKLTHVPNDLSS